MSRTRRLIIALALNIGLVIGQVVAGLIAHSTGLLSDAGHNLTDAASIVLSLLAVRWALKPRTPARSYGNARGTILAALVNAVSLALVTLVIVFEAIRRLIHPVPVDGAIVVPVAAAAIVINMLAMLVVYEHKRDLNMRSVMVHMAADALSSLVVLIAGAVILISGSKSWDRLDPAASLVVAALIVAEAIRLVRESTRVLLESTPSDVDLSALETAMTRVPGVEDMHDLHVWSLSTEYRALSAHIVLSGHPSLEEAQEVGRRVRSVVEEPFDIAHTTLELECERCVDDANPFGVDRQHGGAAVVFPTVTGDRQDDGGARAP